MEQLARGFEQKLGPYLASEVRRYWRDVLRPRRVAEAAEAARQAALKGSTASFFGKFAKAIAPPAPKAVAANFRTASLGGTLRTTAVQQAIKSGALALKPAAPAAAPVVPPLSTPAKVGIGVAIAGALGGAAYLTMAR